MWIIDILGLIDDMSYLVFCKLAKENLGRLCYVQMQAVKVQLFLQLGVSVKKM